jgi:hypothetical protein
MFNKDFGDYYKCMIIGARKIMSYNAVKKMT